MLHKKVLFTTLCDIVPLGLFFDDQKRWRLGKKLFQTNFRFFTPFAAHHLPWIQLRTTNCCRRKVLGKERASFENLLFLAIVYVFLLIWMCWKLRFLSEIRVVFDENLCWLQNIQNTWVMGQDKFAYAVSVQRNPLK